MKAEGERAYQKLNDVNAEVLIDHGPEPDARAREPPKHVRERRVHDEAHLLLNVELAREQPEVLNATRIADVPAAAHEDELNGGRAGGAVFGVLLQEGVERAELGLVVFLRPALT